MTGNELENAGMDLNNLYREETFTDQKVGTIKKMVPVTAAGEIDSEREVVFYGQAQMMTPAGALPLNFELKGATLKEAIEGFADGAQVAMEQTMQELREYRNQAASSIVVPEAGGMGMPGGKIQIP